MQTSAGAELQPEVQAVQDDIDELKTAAENLDSGGAADAATAVSGLVSSAGTLLDSLDGWTMWFADDKVTRSVHPSERCATRRSNR